LVTAQAETEHILSGELRKHSVSVEWNRELLGVDSLESPVAKVSGDSVPVRFVVGCDGAHSAVRRALGVGFAGRQYDGVFALADVSLDWQFPYDTVRTFVSTDGALACFPMKGERRYRLVALLRDGDARNLDLARMQAIVDALAPVKLTLADPTWLTEFRVSHRIVDHWRRGNVFLAGDAAHIHSPVGGQGMNTGIQDALCLGDLLRQVLRGGDPAVLRRYERDRSKVARSVLRGTDLPIRMLLKRDNPLARITRGVILPKLVSNELVQRLVVGAVSELRVARREIAERHKNS
jgi:2-polyprenyl-6-methoxyphenol hydroxylase-like FAD-dependent oxidoreductase